MKEMSGGPEVQYFAEDIDVSWYSRQCQKFITDLVSYKESYKGKL